MICGSKQTFWKSGRISTKSYVKDGLVAMWDGIENAGFGQHSSDISVWKNLGSNGSLHDATRTSSTRSTAWTDNAAVFGYNDATYQFIIPGKLMMNVMKGEWTYELVFTPNQRWLTGTQYPGIFGNHGGGFGIVGGQKNGSSATVSFNLYYPDCQLWQPSTSMFSSGTLATVSQAASNTAKTAVTYKDGVQVASSSNVNVLLDHQGSDNTGNTCIGSAYNQGTAENWRTFDGVIHCIRIYNRPLTAAEVQKNHEIDIKRFSLSDNLALRSNGSAYAVVPCQINSLSEFTFKAKMRLTNCASDYNLFGTIFWGHYTWSSSDSFSMNECYTTTTSDSSRFFVNKSFFSQMAEYKCIRRLDNGYLVNDIYVDGQLIQKGYARPNLSTSSLGNHDVPFAVFAEFNGVYSNPTIVRPTKCPTWLDIQRVSLETSNGMQFDMKAALDNSNVPCFYDSVSQTFVRNAGTGSFSIVYI